MMTIFWGWTIPLTEGIVDWRSKVGQMFTVSIVSQVAMVKPNVNREEFWGCLHYNVSFLSVSLSSSGGCDLFNSPPALTRLEYVWVIPLKSEFPPAVRSMLLLLSWRWTCSETKMQEDLCPFLAPRDWMAYGLLFKAKFLIHDFVFGSIELHLLCKFSFLANTLWEKSATGQWKTGKDKIVCCSKQQKTLHYFFTKKSSGVSWHVVSP